MNLNPIQKIQWLQVHGLFPADVTPGIEAMTVMAEKTVERWNEACPIGTSVKCYGTYGDEKTSFLSTTRSQAWVMGGHTAVIEIAGKSGGYALTHLEPYVSRGEVHGQPNLIDLGKEVACV